MQKSLSMGNCISSSNSPLKWAIPKNTSKKLQYHPWHMLCWQIKRYYENIPISEWYNGPVFLIIMIPIMIPVTLGDSAVSCQYGPGIFTNTWKLYSNPGLHMGNKFLWSMGSGAWESFGRKSEGDCAHMQNQESTSGSSRRIQSLHHETPQQVYTRQSRNALLGLSNISFLFKFHCSDILLSHNLVLTYCWAIILFISGNHKELWARFLQMIYS